jgi:hypothetical protein
MTTAQTVRKPTTDLRVGDSFYVDDAWHAKYGAAIVQSLRELSNGAVVVSFEDGGWRTVKAKTVRVVA